MALLFFGRSDQIRRPFAFINSKIYVHAEQTPSGGLDRLVGEAQQEWHPWRRRYNIFKHREDTFKQFARIDSGFWAWDFWLRDADDRIMASINRNFAGFGRELFTDTGQYVIRFDAVEQELALNQVNNSQSPNQPPSSLVIPPSATDLTLDERAMALATAVTIDIDYFSRHSGAGGMGFPFFMWGGGVGDEYGRAGGGAAGAGAVGSAAGMQEGMEDGEYGEEVYHEEVGPDVGM
ncbi:hypothetical protein QFC20_001536 [Naganishia adeliensis]|uniref:Uncharacterized protein n=1 Tax=Naganishia adeliensis TaxID=92952 RepID=A0ACC2WSF4_9TREE|nr:hypothetical protein QFC20_001536 [Naganishia adeliensis]